MTGGTRSPRSTWRAGSTSDLSRIFTRRSTRSRSGSNGGCEDDGNRRLSTNVAIYRGYDKSLRNVVGRMRLIEAAAGLGDGVGLEDCTSRADIEENCGVCCEGCGPRNGGVAKAGWFFAARETGRARDGSGSGGRARWAVIIILRYV